MTAGDSVADADGAVPDAGDDAPAGEPVTTAAARDLLRDLVETPSPSGDEAAAADVLVEFFRSHGRAAATDAVGNVRAPGDEAVLLTSHVDTVPGELPVEVTEADGDAVLHGRGSVDATGALAAMAAAAVRTGASFAGVVGEETDSRGARHLLADRAAPEAVVNGEPSGWDGIALGYRGLLAGTYRATTEAAHAARPEANAVDLAMDWWAAATEALSAHGHGGDAADSEGADPDGEVFDRVTATPRAIEGGPTDDGTAVEATLSAGFRLPPGTDPEAAAATVEAVTDRGAIEWAQSIPPWLGTPRCDLARAFRAAVREAGGEPRHVRKTGTCDANLFAAAWDCPVVTYGPGDSSLDHAPDERLPLPAFDRSLAVLTAVATEVCG
jgi:LysW-gamma-L-lysine carboxypeptidase